MDCGLTDYLNFGYETHGSDPTTIGGGPAGDGGGAAHSMTPSLPDY